MIHRLAVYLTNKIVSTLPSETKNYDIYIYAFEKMFSQSLIFIFLIALSIYVGVFLQMIAYFSFVVILRGQTSGFHAKSPLGCAILSSIVSMICIFFSKGISKYNSLLFFLCLLLATVYIIRRAPINHILLDLTEFEIICRKKGTMRILTCEVLLVFLLYLFPATRVLSITTGLAIITVAFFMVLSKIYNQEVEKND